MTPPGPPSGLILIGAVFLCVAALLSPGVPAAWGQDPHAEAQWGLAEHLFGTNEYYRAITEYKRFLFYFPQDPRSQAAHLRVAEAYVRGQWWRDGQRAAREFVEQGAVGEPRARALFLLAVCQMQLNLPTEARASLEEVVRSSQDAELRGRAQYLVGEIRGRAGEWAEAAKALERVEPRSGLGGMASQGAERIRSETPLPEKSPWVAGALAAVLPGAGHLYADRARDAALVFSVNAAFTAATVEAIRKENYALAGGLAAVELLWYSGNIFSAVGSIHKHNRSLGQPLLETIQLPVEFEELPPIGRGDVKRDAP
jgi:hypothetical protein